MEFDEPDLKDSQHTFLLSAAREIAAAENPAVPRHPDGAEHENTHRARRFARQLHGRLRLPVHEVDERYSTVEVESGGRVRDVDAAAAALILEQYFRETAAATGAEVPPLPSEGTP
jgi:hypothetical protein